LLFLIKKEKYFTTLFILLPATYYFVFNGCPYCSSWKFTSGFIIIISFRHFTAYCHDNNDNKVIRNKNIYNYYLIYKFKYNLKAKMVNPNIKAHNNSNMLKYVWTFFSQVCAYLDIAKSDNLFNLGPSLPSMQANTYTNNTLRQIKIIQF